MGAYGGASSRIESGQKDANRKTVAETIARASAMFYNRQAEGTDSGSLVIENERLKTTIVVLTKKLKAQTHTTEEVEKLQKQERALLDENEELRSKVSMLEADIQMKVSQAESELQATVSGYEAKLAAQVSAYEGQLAAQVSSYEGQLATQKITYEG